ncbi:MAG TPA: Crp/Fnr family transcriptional regulator [Candidatus Binatia bacterium]|nr:Crp/Fnr family transcriptional regulator [Candidatus Binatia bacterium]
MAASEGSHIVAPLAGDRSLRGLAALKRLQPEQRDNLQRRLQPRDYHRGEVIYQAEDEGGSLYVVLSGVVRLSIPAPSGRRVLLNLLPAGEIFGHTSFVQGGFARIFEAAAYTDVRVGRVSAEDFLDALAGGRGREVRELVSFMTERWITLVLRLARFLAQDLQARVAASLIEAARGFGVEDSRGHVLSLRITQDALADLSAGSLRKVNAVLRRFEDDGLIGKDHGRIVLRSLQALEELALAS